jgi:cytoskeleton protein RodZ
MTDEHDKPDDETAEATSDGPIGGERLAEARRAKQISVLEIAKELHVEEAKIRALENNDFDALGAPVFAKGHLKKYSQLVSVNHDDVLADYYRLTRSQEMPPVVVPRQKPKSELSPGPWIAAVVVVLVLALAYWLLVERPFAPPPVPAATTSAAESEPVSSPEPQPSEDAAPAEQLVEEPAEEAAAEEVLPAQLPVNEPEQPVESAQTPSASTQAPPPVGGADEVRLSVTFVGDCWTEITDASGRRLFFQLGRSGRTVNVAGPGPLKVLFGDAANVEVRVNGEDFSIPAASLRGRTARLNIAGS